MPLGLWQVQYNDLVIGIPTVANPGLPSDFGILEFTGFRGSPNIRLADAPRARQDGAYAGNQYMGERQMTLNFDLAAVSASALESDLAMLEANLGPIEDPTAIGANGVLQALLSPEWENPRQCECRVDQQVQSMTIDVAASLGYYTFSVLLTAPDPRIYDSLTQTVGPFSGTAEMTNSGSVSCYPIIQIAPGATTPSISGAFGTMSFTGDTGGDTWTIDTQYHTIYDSSDTNVYQYLAQGSLWPSLAPGVTALTISGGEMSVIFQSCWAWA